MFVFALLWIVLFLTLGLIGPLLGLSSRFFSSDGASFFDPLVLAVVRATVSQALLSAGFAGLIGGVAGLIFGSKRPLSKFERAVLGIPFATPTVVAAVVAIAWLGKSGWLGSLGLAYSFTTVVIAHVFLNAPWIALQVADARAQVMPAQLECARTLGAGYWTRFRYVIMPAVLPVFSAAIVQVFGYCATSFALVLILGGGPPVQTLETAIYSSMRSNWLDVGQAAAFAFWELLITLVPWFLLIVLGRNTAVSPVSVPAARKGGVSLAILIILLPFIALVGRAFPSGDFFRGLAAPLGVSLKLAFGSGLLALLSSVCGVYVAQILERRCRWLSLPFSLLLTVPAGISVLVLGLGFWLAYGQWIDPFEGSFLAMLVLQAVVLTPFVFRSLWPVAKAGQPMLLELARTLGASKWRAFSVVEWPRWRAPVLGAFGLSVALSLGEVSAVSLFASDSLTPLSFLVARWMGQYRFDDAQAVALLLFVLSALVVTFVACGGSDE